jgi:hypothetical protein
MNRQPPQLLDQPLVAQTQCLDRFLLPPLSREALFDHAPFERLLRRTEFVGVRRGLGCLRRYRRA